jgi:hypothetical protein
MGKKERTTHQKPQESRAVQSFVSGPKDEAYAARIEVITTPVPDRNSFEAQLKFSHKVR